MTPGDRLDPTTAVLSVAEGLDAMVSVQRAVDAAIALTGATYGAIGLFGADGDVEEFVYRGISDDERAAMGPLPTGRGVIGLTARTGHPIRLDRIADHPAAVGFPEHHPPMTTFLGAPIMIDGEIFGSIYLTDKAGGERFSDADEDIVRALANALGVAVRNNRSFEHTRQQERWQRAATSIDYEVLSGSSPVEVMASIAAQARRLSGADVAVVALPDDDDRLIIDVVKTRPVDQLGDTRWSVPRSRERGGDQDGHLAAAQQWLGLECHDEGLLMNAFATARTLLAPGWQAAPAQAPASEAFATAAAIPMRTPERSLGVLGLMWDHATPRLTDPSLEVAESFAAQAAVTLILDEARRSHEKLLVFRDRDRIARDMHDLVVQRVFATGLSLQGLLRSGELPDGARSRVERAIEDLDETLTEIRRTIFDLHTSDAVPPSLRTRVQHEASQAAVTLGFAPEVVVQGPLEELPVDVGDHLVAALREGLSNAVRHAQASSVEVHIAVRGSEICMQVIDDGVGPPSRPERHSGLANLAGRADQLGGVGRLVRAPSGQGSMLVWRVPLAGNPSQPD